MNVQIFKKIGSVYYFFMKEIMVTFLLKEGSDSFSFYDIFPIPPQNVAICPKTFSNRTDSNYKWRAAVTSSDVSPIQSSITIDSL